jgi:hypothetical protein
MNYAQDFSCFRIALDTSFSGLDSLREGVRDRKFGGGGRLGVVVGVVREFLDAASCAI